MQRVALALASTLVPAATAFAQTASVDNFGGGTPGSAGVPVLAYDGAPVVGKPFALRVSSGSANSTAVIGIGLSHAPVFDPTYGATIHVGAPLFALGILPTDASGRTPPFLPLANVGASLAGVEFVVQALVADASATGGLAFTAGLEVRLGEAAATRDDLYPVRTWSTTTKPRHVEFADVDGDGVQDMLTANISPSSFSVWRGLGDGFFAPEVVHPTSPGGSTLAVGDIDSNGAPDLVLGNGDVHLNDGAGNFALGPVSIGPSRPLMLVDVDADGALDVVRFDLTSFIISVELGLGNGTFGAALTTPLAFGSPVKFQVGDIDNDGHVDLACLTSPGDFVHVFLGVGDGTFQDVGFVDGGWDIALADFDGDGHLDLASIYPTGIEETVVVVRFGDGTGQFGSAINTLNPAETGNVSAGDFDGDGRAELVVCQIDFNEMWYHGVTSARQFEPATNHGCVGHLYSVAADIDLDGDLDVASIGTSIRIQYGGGDGTFGVDGSPLVFDNTPSSLRMADLDRDGHLDVVATLTWPGPERLDVALGTPSGGYVPHSTQVFSPGVDLEILDVLLLDGDHELDLLAYDSNNQRVLAFIGNGDGSFGAPFDATSAATAGDPAVGDVDGDGLVDLVFATSPTEFSIFSGVGDGTFALASTLPVPSGRAALFDLDGDGVLDLMSISTSVSTRKGLGGGAFGAPVSMPAGTDPDFIALGDIDHDGRVDLVLASEGSGPNGVTVHKGTAGPAFATATILPVPFRCYDPAFADVDVDGHLDLVAVSRERCGAVVLYGDGTGAFPTWRVHDSGSWSLAKALADVDGDGLLDIVVANERSRDLTLLVNRLVE